MPENTAPAQPGTEYHWIITIQFGGNVTVTQNGTFIVKSPVSRMDMFRLVKDLVTAGLREGRPDLLAADAPQNVLFFELAPNAIIPGGVS